MKRFFISKKVIATTTRKTTKLKDVSIVEIQSIKNEGERLKAEVESLFERLQRHKEKCLDILNRS